MANKYCTHCGALNRATRFCPNCGQPVSPSAQAPKPHLNAQSQTNKERKAEIERAEQAAMGCRYLVRLGTGIFIVIAGMGSLIIFPIGTFLGIVMIIVGINLMRAEP
jgi:uncharacterized membrane protein YvbJ